MIPAYTQGCWKHPYTAQEGNQIASTSQILADTLTLFQSGGQIMPTTSIFTPTGFSDIPTTLTLGILMSQYFFSANFLCFKLRLTLIFTVFTLNLQIIERYQEIPFCPKDLEFNPRGVSTIIQLQNKEKCKFFIMILV